MFALFSFWILPHLDIIAHEVSSVMLREMKLHVNASGKMEALLEVKKGGGFFKTQPSSKF